MVRNNKLRKFNFACCSKEGNSHRNQKNTKKKHATLADGTPLVKNKKGEFVPDAHAKSIAMKAVAAHKKSSESVPSQPSNDTKHESTSEIKPTETAGDFCSRILTND